MPIVKIWGAPGFAKSLIIRSCLNSRIFEFISFLLDLFLSVIVEILVDRDLVHTPINLARLHLCRLHQYLCHFLILCLIIRFILRLIILTIFFNRIRFFSEADGSQFIAVRSNFYCNWSLILQCWHMVTLSYLLFF